MRGDPSIFPRRERAQNDFPVSRFIACGLAPVCRHLTLSRKRVNRDVCGRFLSESLGLQSDGAEVVGLLINGNGNLGGSRISIFLGNSRRFGAVRVGRRLTGGGK